MGKSTISIGPFSSSQTVYVYQRVTSRQYGWKNTTRDETHRGLRGYDGKLTNTFRISECPKNWGGPHKSHLRSRNMMTCSCMMINNMILGQQWAAIFRQLSQEQLVFLWRWWYRIVTLLTWAIKNTPIPSHEILVGWKRFPNPMGYIIIPSKPGRIKSPFSQSWITWL